MMDTRRKALGRGLSALIPGGEDREIPESTRELPIESIDPNPYQPRGSFPDAQLDELTDSIRERGVLQPLIVRRHGERYQLVAGERRLRAAKKAGIGRVPVVILEVGDREALEIALIENIQRENLNPIEVAHAYHRLHDEFGLTQEVIAARVGKNRSTVTNSMRLLQLPLRIQEQIISGAISAGHARGILALRGHEAQVDVANAVATRRLSVRDTERLVRERNQRSADLDRREVEEQLSRALGTRVRLKAKKTDEGRIEIEYYSAEQLNDLVTRLMTQHEAAVAF